MTIESYRGWFVRYDPTPIPIRDFDWIATGPDFDASWEGEEDGYVSSGGQVNASTRDGLIAEIDAWFEENVALASVDGRRMAETAKTGSVPQGTTSAVAESETPTPSSAQPGDA